MDTSETKAHIVALLKSTERKGIEALIDWMLEKGFFIAPASSKFHGCFRGGLAEHSLRLYKLVNYWNAKLKLDSATGTAQKPLRIKEENIIIACLLHDICKVGAYIGDAPPYKWNRNQPDGHALLSIVRAKKYIELVPIELMMIQFHMGIYALHEFYDRGSWSAKNGEYNLRSDKAVCEGMNKKESKMVRYGKSLANAWFHNPICKIMYFMDEISALEAKTAKEMVHEN